MHFTCLRHPKIILNFAAAKQQSQSKVLQKVTLDVFKNSDCDSIYDVVDKVKNGVDEETKLCVGSLRERKNT